MVRIILVILMLGAGIADGLAQGTRKSAQQNRSRLVYTPRDLTVEVWGGMGLPMAHRSFTRYWLRGPAGGFTLLFPASDRLRIGFGADATLFSFRKGNFALLNPEIRLQVKDIVLVDLHLTMRHYFTPGLRASPYIDFTVGFARISGAEYKDIVNGVRVTYYEVPGTTRLAAGIHGGADYYLGRRFAVQADLGAVYVHNDPNLSFLLSGRAGVKFTL